MSDRPDDPGGREPDRREAAPAEMVEEAAAPPPAEAAEERSPEGPVGGTVRRLGAMALNGAHHAGRAGILFGALVGGLGHPSRYLAETWRQAKRFGVDSLGLVLLVAALSGSVLAQQSGYQFTTLPMWVVGQAVAAGMLTELAPVLTAVVLAGRVGAGIGAEIGTMKVTDQVDALRTLGRDPVVELVVPRVLAGTLVLVPLVILANAVGIWSGWITSINLLPMTTAEYVQGVQSYYHGPALIFSLVKAVAFGFTITFTACYVGLQTEGGAAGVGKTTTNAVVAIIVFVMVLDVVLAPIYKAVS